MEQFSYESNGYNRSEVNEFIKQVTNDTEEIVERVRIQKEKIDELTKELNHYKKLEYTLNSTIEFIKETKEEIKNLSKKESELIIEKAKNDASRIVNESLLEAEKLEIRKKELKKNINDLKNKIKIVIEDEEE